MLSLNCWKNQIDFRHADCGTRTFVLNRLDWKANEYGGRRTTQAGPAFELLRRGKYHLWRNPDAPRREMNCAGLSAHRYRCLRFASIRPERAHRDLTLLQC